MTTDIHPKVYGATFASAVVSLGIALLGAFGHPVPPAAVVPLTTIGAFVGGYIPAGKE